MPRRKSSLILIIRRGYTTTGSGGAAVTPSLLIPSDGVAASTVKRNNTTVAADGTPLILMADAWNIQAPFLWLSDQNHRLIIAPSHALGRADHGAGENTITTNGTLVFEELA